MSEHSSEDSSRGSGGEADSAAAAEVGGFEAIAREIAAQLGGDCAPEPESGVAGGSIHRSYRWRCAGVALFVKVADHSDAVGLEAEAAGLLALADAHAVRVPRVLARGTAGRSSFLALEWIESPAGFSF